jgi:chromodomain-helicase-DNA-binding protein 1
MRYRGFSKPVDLSSRLQSKPVPIKNNVSRRRSTGLHNSEGYDDGDNEEEDEDGNFFVIVAFSVRFQYHFH